MIDTLSWGACINRHGPGGLGFDAFAAHRPEGLFTLSDGANSCPLGGQAARWLVGQMSQPGLPRQTQALAQRVEQLHQQMVLRFPESAATLLHVQADAQGLRLLSVGDSFLTVFERLWPGWRGWRVALSMPRDLDAQGHPSQLMGSEVMHQVHQLALAPRGPLVIAMMSDGPAHALGMQATGEVLSRLGRRQPSAEDLDYLSEDLVARALAQGCTDDASVALIWVDWP